MPTELLLTIGSGIAGFIFKNMAQNRANNFNLIKMSIEKDKTSSLLADAAAKRSNPMMRKVLAFACVGLIIGSIVLVSFFPSIETSLIVEKAQKSFLGFKFGKSYDIVTTTGLMIPLWFRYIIITIISFTFGTGASKISN